MSEMHKHKDEVDGAHPVVSTRYDARLIEHATRRLGVSKAELLKRALDHYIAGLLVDAA